MPVMAGRQYATQFPQQNARYICTQVTLSNPFLVVDYECDIVVRYTKADGSMFGTLSDSLSIPASQRTYIYSTGRGWKEAGAWEAGTYSVEVLIDRALVAETAFTVNAPTFASTLPDFDILFP